MSDSKKDVAFSLEKGLIYATLLCVVGTCGYLLYSQNKETERIKQ